MKLSHYTLKNISTDHIIVPDESILDLPEKVLQFGTGMLLRGLPDYFIDKANRKGVFNGRIVVVKSTSKGDSSAFEKQDGLYTICERGVVQGEKIERDIISSAISRVLNAHDEWDEILKCAHNPEIKIIISNTTEMGLQFVKDDIRRYPPSSFPGKLLSFLLERFIAFDGKDDSGFVIVPTELVSDNGKVLESIVLELAHLNGLEEEFIEWLEGSNKFCSSLVDRIVTGMPSAEERDDYFEKLGYRDELLTVTEAYSLWAIEGDQNVKEILSFAKADESVKIVPDIDVYRELKLRLLNATHTYTSGIAFLSGIDTVKEAMDDQAMSEFLEMLMAEIKSSIPLNIDEELMQSFIQNVQDRFRNPHIKHHWKTIAHNYSQKMKLRCIPLVVNYYEQHENVLPLSAFSFAAYLYYTKPVKTEQGKYFGKLHENFYLIEDERAVLLFDLWKNNSDEKMIKLILGDTAFWEYNLLSIQGFKESVLDSLGRITAHGMGSALQHIIKQTKQPA